MMPPLPPPSGISATAHFQVIQVASARTVSMVSFAVEADAALIGAAGVVVLDAVALEDSQRAIVHADGDAEGIFAHRPAQDFGDARVELQAVWPHGQTASVPFQRH